MIFWVMKITISGVVGSGKSTVAKAISNKLDLDYFYVGQIMRDMAIERGVSLDGLTIIAKKDKSVDYELDERQREFNSNNGSFVMDSRLGFHFIPDSFKIYLKVDINEAAKRIYNASRDNQKYSSEEECLEKSKQRIESEKIRYKQCYDIDFGKEDVFDLVIDTTSISIEEVIRIILESIPNKSH